MIFSEKKYVNRTAVQGHTIIDVILFLAYALEVFKGARTIGYFAVFSVLTVIPVIAEWVIYRKNGESPAIKHMIGISYSVLYLFVIFTTNSMLPFIYAYPMFIVIILYMDIRFNVLIGIGAVLGNAVYVVYYALTAGYAASEIPDVEIRLMATLLTVVFMVMTTIAVKKVNGHKLEQIKAQAEETGKLVDNILATSQEMIGNIAEVTNRMTELGESVEKVHDSMEEVSTGSTETAESVQIQMQRTGQIQQHIGRVKDTAASIEQNIRETVQKVTTGREQMDALAGQVEKSKTANAEVQEKMEELETYTKQMNTIIETITSIADNTALLALNASIEAARAGESGKGFAVVAGQITELANQTQVATANITGLIGNINKELEYVAEAVDVVTKSNEANAESTQTVKTNFTGITRGTEDISHRTQELLQIIEELESANGDIVENIQTISAITEEISAHANETFSACDENSRLVVSVSRIVDALNEDAQKLQNV